jgi:flagellar protein FlaG
MEIHSTTSTVAQAPAQPHRSNAPPVETAATVAKPAAAPAELATAVQQPTPVPSLEQLAQAVKKINKVLQTQSQNLEFTIDSDSKRTIIKVVDQGTKEVLRQIPTEETLEIAKAIDQTMGLLIRQKA